MLCEIKDNIRTIKRWYIALNKRLLKRVEFIIMLLSLPLLVLGIMSVSKQKKGLLDIGIVAGTLSNSDVRAVVNKLKSEKSVLDFEVYEDEQLAKEKLQRGKLDIIWVLPDSLDDIGDKSIEVIQGNDSTINSITREKLYAVLYPYIAHCEYIKYMKKINISDTDILDKYFNNINIEDDFIKFEGINGKSPYEELDYITYPIRGFMCIWLFVGSLTANIYFLSDEKNGLFSMTDRKLRRVIAPVYSIGISTNLATVMLLTLFLTRQVKDLLIEISAMFLIVTSFILITDILRNCFKRSEILEALIFPIVLFLIIFAPVIFDVRVLGIRFITNLDPIYYYLSMVEDGSFYEFVLFVIGLLTVDRFICYLRNMITKL